MVHLFNYIILGSIIYDFKNASFVFRSGLHWEIWIIKRALIWLVHVSWGRVSAFLAYLYDNEIIIQLLVNKPSAHKHIKTEKLDKLIKQLQINKWETNSSESSFESFHQL